MFTAGLRLLLAYVYPHLECRQGPDICNSDMQSVSCRSTPSFMLRFPLCTSSFRCSVKLRSAARKAGEQGENSLVCMCVCVCVCVCLCVVVNLVIVDGGTSGQDRAWGLQAGA